MSTKIPRKQGLSIDRAIGQRKQGLSIDRAIGQLRLLARHPLPGLMPDEREAIQLGKEALERIQRLRQFCGKELNTQLPGETERQ